MCRSPSPFLYRGRGYDRCHLVDTNMRTVFEQGIDKCPKHSSIMCKDNKGRVSALTRKEDVRGMVLQPLAHAGVRQRHLAGRQEAAHHLHAGAQVAAATGGGGSCSVINYQWNS